MIIFDKSTVSKSLLKEKDDMGGFTKLLVEDGFFLFLCCWFYRSVATFSLIFASIFLIFAWVLYGLSFDDRHESDGVSRKGNGESCRFFSLSMTSDCSFRLLQIELATGRTIREVVNAHLVNASINLDDSVQRSIVWSSTSSSLQFCVIRIIICSEKLKDAALKPWFADTMPVRNASESSFSATFGVAFLTLLV